MEHRLKTGEFIGNWEFNVILVFFYFINQVLLWCVYVLCEDPPTKYQRSCK